MSVWTGGDSTIEQPQDQVQNQDKNQNGGVDDTSTNNEPDSTINDTKDTHPEADGGKSTIDKIVLDDGEYTLDEIKKWKSGYMMQADYTRKTQELADQRRNYQSAIEFYEYLQNNPEVAQKVVDVIQGNVPDNDVQDNQYYRDPAIEKRLVDAEKELRQLKIERKISKLKEKYPDMDEKAVLQEAIDRGIDDFELIYNAMRGRNMDPNKLKQELTEQIKKDLLEEIKKNGVETSTLISEGDTGLPVKDYGLTPEEKRAAEIFGMSYEEYAKYK